MIELYLPPLLKNKVKKPYRIEWTPEMINTLKSKFATTYNRVLAKEIGVSMRTLIRKARDLGLEKENEFLDLRRDEITKMATKAHPPHPFKGVKGWCIPNGEKTRFKQGNISAMSFDRSVVEKCHKKRNATIKRDRIRIKLGLEPLT